MLLTIALAVLQWVHVIFAVLWFGSILFTNLILFRELHRLPPDLESAVRTRLSSGSGRRNTLIMASGTVGLGIVRGLTGGVLDSLATPYGMTFIAAGVIGISMVAWLVLNPYRTRLQRMPPGPERETQLRRQNVFNRLYLAGFPVIFTLMIAMRFGY